jgi:6-pyruvoyltetrahydropterin/6-carboxytetrahydropterin synthase
MDQNPTAEAIAHVIFEYTAAQGFPVVAVRLWETPASYATYQAHGAAADGG